MNTWKEALEGRIAPDVAREIDIFETQIELRKQGKIEEKLFAETRLRRGAYGQRYDNGQRHDGRESRAIDFPSHGLTKGPATVWDAPGMQRIKLPFGALSAAQMDALADVAEEHSDGILHVTTRQDIQLHFVHIEDTPTVMRRLAAVGITTREACGNTVRNVTACPLSGVCPDEAFDVTPYAHAATYFLLGHPDTQAFGRKFKLAFSGCKPHPCAITAIHDFGAIAVRRVVDGRVELGFELYVGGGLGAVPHQAKLFDEFIPAAELLPVAQAIARVFARLGEKNNRQKARIKFLVAKLGIAELRRLVHEERAHLPTDPRWTRFLSDLTAGTDGPRPDAGPPAFAAHAPGFDAWRRSNVQLQRQPGYAIATVRLPLGDLTSDQMRALADIARALTGDTVRTTIEQNLVFRWVREADLPSLHARLSAIGLGQAGAGTIADITSCPGTDTCKLGISSSRGLAAELGARLDARATARDGDRAFDPKVAELRVKTSGCFNACGQHHVADIGLLGVSRNVGGRRVPHFQVVLGGQWKNNGGAYGLAIGAVPSKRIPEAIELITDHYVAHRSDGESFQAFIERVGRAPIRQLLADLCQVPTHAADPSYYSDWGDPREYTIGDMGVGECAGEVVTLTQFGLAASEREVFEAQLTLEKGQAPRAARLAYGAMIQAAKSLVQVRFVDVTDDPAQVLAEFRARLHDTKLFADPFAGDKFAQFLFSVDQSAFDDVTAELAHQRIEEAQLFIEAAHACYDRMSVASAQPAK